MPAMLTLLLSLVLFPSALFADGKDLVFYGLSYPLTLQVRPSKSGQISLETAFSAPAARDYDTVLIQGEMPSPDMSVELVAKSRSIFLPNPRYRRTGFRRFPNGRFWARFSADGPTRQPVKISVTDLGMQGPAPVVLYGTELAEERELREEAPVSTAPYVPAPALFVPASAPFRLYRRAEWNAAPPASPYSEHKPYYFTLHHTQAHYPKSFQASVDEMLFIQDFHQHGRGWIDIAYHFLIDPAGNVFEGRPVNAVGAHVKNRNTGNIGISIMGNYHAPAHDAFTPETQASFVTVARWVKDSYAVNVSSFYAHRELGKTDCPGDDLYAKKDLLRSLVFQPAPAPASSAGVPLTPAQAEALRRIQEAFR